MPDVTVKLSDGTREITVEINGSDDDPLTRAEDTATRLYGIAVASSPAGQRTGFAGWALASDNERSPEE
ncbi:VCBS domain-containing protein [Streptomyces sp. SAS_275]|uniref:VCBS domain-containing protein n=1 Tax=Streptomyces sp. SAS_275 TaxID=3412746 RepID=UPI00403C4076